MIGSPVFSGEFLLLLWPPTFVFFACLYHWLRSLREARTTEDIATSTIRGAAQGYVELQGYARPLQPGQTSPMLGRKAVWWRLTIQAFQPSGPPRVEVRNSGRRFYLEDASGRCLVDTTGAQITPNASRTWRCDEIGPPAFADGPALTPRAYLCTEDVLLEGTRLYVRGEFRTVRTGAQPLDLMREKLVAWQADENKRAVLDVDRDGRLSETELEAGRRAALFEARREAGTSVGAADIVVQPADGRPFVISNLRQQAHATFHRQTARLALVGTFASGILLLAALFWIAAR